MNIMALAMATHHCHRLRHESSRSRAAGTWIIVTPDLTYLVENREHRQSAVLTHAMRTILARFLFPR